MCVPSPDLVRTHSQLGMIKALAPGIRPLWGIRTLQDLVKAQGFSVLLAGSLPRVCSLCRCSLLNEPKKPVG